MNEAPQSEAIGRQYTTNWGSAYFWIDGGILVNRVVGDRKLCYGLITDGLTPATTFRFLEYNTNYTGHEALYLVLLALLGRLEPNGYAMIYTDNKLLVNQLTMGWEVAEDLKPLHSKVRAGLLHAGASVQWAPRGEVMDRVRVKRVDNA